MDKQDPTAIIGDLLLKDPELEFSQGLLGGFVVWYSDSARWTDSVVERIDHINRLASEYGVMLKVTRRDASQNRNNEWRLVSYADAMFIPMLEPAATGRPYRVYVQQDGSTLGSEEPSDVRTLGSVWQRLAIRGAKPLAAPRSGDVGGCYLLTLGSETATIEGYGGTWSAQVSGWNESVRLYVPARSLEIFKFLDTGVHQVCVYVEYGDRTYIQFRSNRNTLRIRLYPSNEVDLLPEPVAKVRKPKPAAKPEPTDLIAWEVKPEKLLKKEARQQQNV